MTDLRFLFGMKEYDDAIAEMGKQDDRSAAIVAASLLEDHLVAAIRSRFMHSDEKVEGQFMKGYGPLASFKSRIDLGFLLGAYDKNCLDGLIHIKNIRNRFAHEIKPHSFETREVADQLEFLPSQDEIVSQWADTMASLTAMKTQTEKGAQLQKEGIKALEIIIEKILSSQTSPRAKYMRYVENRTMSLRLASIAGNKPDLDFLISGHL